MAGRPNSKYTLRIRQAVQGAIYRCTRPSHKNYDDYGDRGIQVLDTWVIFPSLFMAYLVTLPGHDDPALLLDRINNNGHYEPGNLRFVTHVESLSNRRPYAKRQVI